jgi:hypothetical protein
VKKILVFCFSLLAFQAYAQNYNDRSTTGPVPPKGIDVVGYVSTSKAANVTQLISGVPAYLWTEGCGPTVVGMLAGYYDSHGFPNLFPGDASTRTTAVSSAIASTQHIDDYAKPNENTLPVQADKSELPAGDEHTNNCIADYMLTSRSIIGNIWGWSKGVDIKPSWENYIANFTPEYTGSATQYYYNSSTWDTLISNIDRNKPMLLLVDTNTDGLTDHFVIANGYKIENDIKYYGCFNTWDVVQHWYQFQQMAAGVSWGVARCYTFSIHNKLPVPAGTITGPSNVCRGSNPVDYTVPVIADATSYVWTLPSGATGTSSTNSISVTFGTGSVSGNITVFGRNSNGDGTASSLSVTVNTPPSAPTVGTVTQPTCAVPSGSVVLSGLPSSGTWTLTRSPGGATYQGTGTSTTISGLSTGTYVFTVTNASSCVSSSSSDVLINANPANPATPVTTLTQPTCSVSTGSIRITSPTGSGMTYSINGSTYTNTTGIFSSVASGNYTVTAKNSSGCISLGASVAINAQPATPSNPAVTLVQPSCFVSTGTITITSPIGLGMTYSIDGSTYSNTTGIFGSVSSGTYVVTAKSSLGCISSGTSTTINSQPSTPSTPAITLTQPTCSVSTGTITITSPKAVGMTYSIDGTTYTNTTGIFTPLAAGTYSVTAKNSSGCISSASSVSINVQPATPAAPEATLTQPTCSLSTGTITITSPKEGGMTYSMNGSTYTNTTGIFSGIVAGPYTLTAKNSVGCISSGSGVTITAQPTTPSSPVTILTQPTCSSSTGTIVITSPSGTGMTYSIDGSTYTNTTGTFTSVDPETYSVTAKSSAGCISTGTSATINAQPATPVAPVALLTQPSCSVSTGTISITSPTGAGMTYSLNGSTYINTTGTFSFVVTGTYTLTAKSSSGCISAGTSVTINQQPATPSTPDGSIVQPDCSVSTGVIEITTPKGIGYNYSIDGNDYTNTSGLFTLVPPGTYTVTARNLAGCISEGTDVTIIAHAVTPQAPVISLTDNILHSSSVAGNSWYNQDGIISSATAQDYTVMLSGIYYAIVTKNGCSSVPSNSINVIITGDENPVLNEIRLKAYPNPFEDELILERAGTMEIAGYEILNSLGQAIIKGKTGEKSVIETSVLPRGVYILRVKNGRSYDHIKIIRK